MFGFGKKKVADSVPVTVTNNKGGKGQRSSADKEKINDQLVKLGLIGIPGLDDDIESDNSDGDLENELLDLLGEDGDISPEDQELLKFMQEDEAEAPVPPKRKNQLPVKQSEPTPTVAAVEQAHAQYSGDPNQMSPVDDVFKAPPAPQSILESLEQRLDKYKIELDKAKGDGGKSRRMGRIVKQYEDAIKSCKSGAFVAYEELPTPPGFAPIPFTAPSPEPAASEVTETPASMPLSAVPEKPSVPPIPELKPLQIPAKAVIQNVCVIKSEVELVQERQLNIILARQKDFRNAAKNAKQKGDVEQAKEFLRIAIGFDKIIGDSESGLPVDIDALPSDPESILPLKSEDSKLVTSSDFTFDGGVETFPKTASDLAEPVQDIAAGNHPQEDIFNAPPAPQTILEALEQRLEKYKHEVEKAQGNDGKARRMGRIVKQYEDAIKSSKKGKPVAYDELPTPPGFAPIPYTAPPPPPVSASEAATKPLVPPMLNSATAIHPPVKHSGSINRGDNKPGTKLTLQEKQLRIILTRQKQFRDAALNAKQSGDLEQAKEFLRTAKGFDKLIRVSQAGLPVDMATLPVAPESVAALEAEDFDLVTSADCIAASGSGAEVFTKLEADLTDQLKICMRTRDHFKNIGDIGSSNRFEQMALESKRDLDTLRLAVRKGDSIPKYHYETKVFSITECNADLGEDDIEISILKGINFKVANPADVDTFIKVELPYPTAEEAQVTKTPIVKNSNNPDYNATYKMSINRAARNFPRFIHRHGFKLEVWSKGGLWYGITRRLIFCRRGLFRGNTLIGVATIKLTPLESKCALHDAFDIMDGRKAVGKIEVKVRLRDPVVTKEITQKKQKWLSIDRA